MQLDWRAISGPALTTATALTAFFVDRHIIAVPNPAPLFVCIVAFASSVSGIASGLVSAAIAVASSAMFFLNHRALPGYDMSDMARMMMLAATAAGTAVITGLLRQKWIEAFASEQEHHATSMRLAAALDKVDIVQGTLAKAFGVVGGYIASTAATIDFVRSCGSGFIFTTSLPPAIAAAALASVRHVSAHPDLRVRHQERAASLKRKLAVAGLPVMDSATHIVPVFVGDAALCKQASDLLLERHAIYVQPINYPTVARGTERLRLTPTPLHGDDEMARLVAALQDVWQTLGLGLRAAAE